MMCEYTPTRARGNLLSCHFWPWTVNADLMLRVEGADGGKNESKMSTDPETSKWEYSANIQPSDKYRK